ncbi:MAG: hypothetical protein AMK73_04985 [Planctomycetes bacterium SM23_32]|nr:MAG: hypothetical protein AMK73_04985 [Planctomycetes bacterium SM23_32]
MDVFEAIRQRRSIRSYEDREVEEEKLMQVLQAARGQQFVAEAPVVIVACAVEHEHVMPCGHPSHLIDVAIATDHITLAARALGLGTCWIGAFDRRMVRDVLGIPDSVEVVELMPLGYPTDWPAPRSRKGLDEAVCYDGWQD